MAERKKKTFESSLARLEEVLNEPNSITDPERPVLLPERVKGDLRFKIFKPFFTLGCSAVIAH